MPAERLLRGGSKSFDAAAKLLPRAIRDPAIALYAFCREADDVIDADQAGGLEWLRERLTLAYAQAADRHAGRPRIRGSRGTICHPARIAGGAAGRVCLGCGRPSLCRSAGIAGLCGAGRGNRRRDDGGADGRARPRTPGRGGRSWVAMQLSNIARDVGEDARNGRVYLPLDWLAQAGIDPDAFLADPCYSAGLGGWWACCWKRRMDITVARPQASRGCRWAAGWVLGRLGCYMRKSGGRWCAAAWTRCPAGLLCRIGARSACWRPGLPGWRCRCDPWLASACRKVFSWSMPWSRRHPGAQFDGDAVALVGGGGALAVDHRPVRAAGTTGARLNL